MDHENIMLVHSTIANLRTMCLQQKCVTKREAANNQLC